MKVCPFCQAKIEENARFCLYCMTPLTEKQAVKPEGNKRRLWLWLPVALLAILLVIGGIWWALDSIPLSGTQDGSSTLSDPLISAEKGDTPSTNHTADRQPSSSEQGGTSGSKDGQTENNTSGGSTHKGNATGKDGTTRQSGSTKTSKSTQKTSTTTRTNSNTIENLTWYYRKAYSGDHYTNYNKVATANGIVVTGFDRIPANGIYKIPDTIDGKTVVGINMSSGQGYTFASPGVAQTAKAIYLPPAVNKITYNLFPSLVNLTDLYIAGEFLYMEPSALPPQSSRNGTLTIHASDTCWCLYGVKAFSVYCSVNGYNEYRVRFSKWTDTVY